MDEIIEWGFLNLIGWFIFGLGTFIKILYAIKTSKNIFQFFMFLVLAIITLLVLMFCMYHIIDHYKMLKRNKSKKH